MFKAIKLRNHQGHEDAELELVKGVNVIYGLSQAGKTSIIRAIKLLSKNRPGGARFYSNFAPDTGKTEVEIELDDNRTVSIIKEIRRNKKTKEKELSSTLYKIGENEYQPGKDVPDEVTAALNIGEINISSQFDKPFLILSSPGEIGRTINRLTKLEEVDGWKSEFTKEINKNKQKTDIISEEAKKIEQELARYKGFEDLEDLIQELTKIDKEITQQQAQRFSIDRSLIKIEGVEKKLQTLEKQVSVESLVKQIEKIDADYERLIDQKRLLNDFIVHSETIAELEDLLKQCLEAVAELGGWQDKIDQRDLLRKLVKTDKRIKDLELVLIDSDKAAKVLSEWEEISKKRDMIKRGIDKIDNIDLSARNMGQTLNEYRELYLYSLKREKQCPVCLQSIDDKTIERIGKEL